MAAETMKDAASSAKTTPAEAEATSTPPIAGPAIRKTIGRISWSSAFACASRSAGTMSGTSASNAGAKNAAPVPYTRGDDGYVPHLDGVGERQHGEGRAGHGAQQIRRHHHHAAVEAVARHSADQQEDDRRNRHRDAHDRHRRGRVRQLVDLPGDRYQEGAVAEQRHAHREPELAELRVPERPEQADAR